MSWRKRKKEIEPAKISPERLRQLDKKVQEFHQEFSTVLASDIPDKPKRLFEILDSVSSRDERYVAFLVLISIFAEMGRVNVMIDLLNRFNQAAEPADRDIEDDSDGGGSTGNGRGGNGEPKN